MTPDEAKSKWCPFARAISSEKESTGTHIVHMPVSFNRVGVEGASNTFLGPPHMCIADKCMAWRWGYDQNGNLNETHGYCGLAGEP